MSTTVIYFLIGFSSLIIGFLIAYLFSKLKFEKETSALTERNNQSLQQLEENKNLLIEEKNEFNKQIDSLRKEKDLIRNEKETINITYNTLKVEKDNLNLKLIENKKEVENLQKKFSIEFENLANKILEEKSHKFTEQNKENLKQILNPLQEKIQIFERKVEISNKENTERHIKLGEQLRFLNEQNIKISTEATNLTKALKGDSKTQGNWGELILERVLEKSGLRKDHEYELEKSFTIEGTENKRLRPDVIIHLPDNKKMIVDSKVSLTAYEKYVNSEDNSEVSGEKAVFLKEHILSLNRHVQQLSDKKYEDLYEIESPDFVLLFVPIEPAFAVAVNHDNELYNKAFDKNIIIVTPTTLLATLRTIDSMWNNEKQQQNALEIAKQAGALYDKFEGLMTDLTKVGKKMDEAKKEYKGAMNKLFEGSGNLIRRVENIKKLGAKAKKQLPETIVKRALENE